MPQRKESLIIGIKEVEIEQIALILAYNYLCLVFLENWSNFANLSLFGKMPQRKESLFRNERSGEIWVLRIFSSWNTARTYKFVIVHLRYVILNFK